MSVVIKHLSRCDYNYAIIHNGIHVNAIAEFSEGGKEVWRVWKQRELDRFNSDELAEINKFVANLNSQVTTEHQ